MSDAFANNSNRTVHDVIFKNAGLTPGIQIWRIKNFEAVPLEESEYGCFYSGDCYIVLSTKRNGRWDVHFWLGKHSTQDEQGTAAIKTVDLDDYLGGGPVQYREIQGYESSLFLSYFKRGIKYLKGGHQSGFRNISDRIKPTPRLFCCKGKRNVRCKQVKFSNESLNLGDVFILDNISDIYVWCPPESGRLERNKGLQIAHDIRDQDHTGQSNVHVLDQQWNSHETFWRLLGGKCTVKPANMGGSDEDVVKTDKPQISLYRVSDSSGSMEVKKIAQGDISVDQLDSNDCFILDAASSGIFVWIGKKGTINERKKSLSWAESFLQMQGKSVSIPVVRVLQGSEPSIFLQWFTDAEEKKKKKFKPRLYQCSDESGRLLVEEICKFTQEELDGDDVMILDVGDVIYVWIGKTSTDNELKHARVIAQKYLDGMIFPRPATAVIRNVYQSKEGQDFTKYFPNWIKHIENEEAI